MPVSETSKMSYQQVKLEGLGPRQQEVFNQLWRAGYASNRELSLIMNVPINQITPRINELVKIGCVVSAGKQYDDETRRLVNTWKCI